MYLSAVIVPPTDVVQELARAIASVVPKKPRNSQSRSDQPGPGQTGSGQSGAAGRPPAAEQPGSRHRGARRGLFGRKDPDSAETSHAPQLDIVPIPLLHLPLAAFGNLATLDVVTLADALRKEAASWERPVLRFSGAAALEWPGDTSVWVRVAGDNDHLDVVGKGVAKVAQSLDLFVDRRRFRPWMSVGTINEQTDATYLEELVARLDRFDGIGWTVPEIVLLNRRPDEGETLQEYALVPLA